MRPVLAEQPIEVARTDRAMHHHRRGEQTHVADSVGGERPHGRPHRVAAFEEESDQERRRDAEQFPAGEQHVDTACQHHQIHSGAKNGQQQEEPGEPRLAMEIFSREGVDQTAEAGRKADVGHGERIGHEFDRGFVMPHREPRPEVDDLRDKTPCRQHGEREQPGDEPGGEPAPDDQGCGPLRRRPAEQRGHAYECHRCRRGGKLADDEQRDDVVVGHHE